MRPADNIEKLISDVAIDTSAETDKAVLGDVLKVLENSKESRSAKPGPNLGRIIMKSRITKLAAAAAAIAIGVIGFWLQGGVTTKVYGMSDALDLIKQAKTLRIQGRFFCQPPLSDQGNVRVALPLDYSYDLENGRYCLCSPGIDIHGEPIYFTTVFDGEYIMKVGPQKTVSYIKLSDYQRRVEMRKLYRSAFFVNLAQDNLEQIEGSICVGQEEFDGTHYDIWQTEFNTPHPREEQSCRISSWVCPSTGELGRVEVWEKRGDTEWYQTAQVEKIERNAILPRDVFDTEPPEGSNLDNTKETAMTIELGDTGLSRLDETQYKLLLRIHIAFTLNDGSVIVCWRSRIVSEASQAVYFESLKTGGDLPPLPLVIYALSPMPQIEGLQYIGYHVAYSRKGDRYYEWSLYVSDRDPPPRSHLIGYQCHQEYNTDVQAEYNNTKIYGDLTIESEKEFDTWLLGAMAELSDDGLVPEQVTYQNVLRLAEEIRASAKE